MEHDTRYDGGYEVGYDGEERTERGSRPRQRGGPRRHVRATIAFVSVMAAVVSTIVVWSPPTAAAVTTPACEKGSVCLDASDTVVLEGSAAVIEVDVPAQPFESSYTVQAVSTAVVQAIASAPDDVSFDRTVVVPAGATNFQVAIAPVQDAVPERDETFTVQVLEGDLFLASTVVTIVDDDTAPGATMSVTALTPNDPNAAVLTYDASERGPFVSLDIDLATGEGPNELAVVPDPSSAAELGVDYFLNNSLRDFAEGGTSFHPIITLVGGQGFKDPGPGPGDGIQEGIEEIVLDLYSIPADPVSGDGLAPGVVFSNSGGEFRRPAVRRIVVRILDDSTVPAFTVGDVTIDEGGNGAVPITRADASSALNLTVRSSDGSATAGVDYAAVDQELQFAVGETTANVPVSTFPDSSFETDETFTVEVSAGGLQQTSTVTITNDDPLPAFDIDTLSPIDEGSGQVSVSVLTSPAAGVALTFEISTSDLEATAGEDYQPLHTHVTVPAGSTSSNPVFVTIIDDPIAELSGRESFQVSATDADGTSLFRPIVIVDNDPDTVAHFVRVPGIDPPGQAFRRNITEGNTDTTIQFQVGLTGTPVTAPFVVDIVANSFSAGAGDYKVEPLSLTFEPGDGPKTVTFTAIGDRLSEIDEVVSLGLSSPTSEVLGQPDDGGLITIVDDDTLPRARVDTRPVGSPNPPLQRSLGEGTASPAIAVLEVGLLDPYDEAADGAYHLTTNLVGLDSDSVDRILAGDVTVSPTELSFGFGQTIKFLTVTVAPNDVPQPDLHFLLTLEGDQRMFEENEPDDVIEFTVTDDDAATGTGDELRTGILDWFDDWFDGFDPSGPIGGIELSFDLPAIDWPALDLPEVSPPVLPDVDLGDVFDLDQLFAGVQAPQFDADADALEEIVADFDSVGCPADFVAGGVGGKPVAAPGDVIQVRCTRTLAQILEQSGYTGPDLNGATPDVLKGLADELGLDGEIAWSLSGEVVLVAGVDLQGFYVLGGSGARLDLDGSGTVSGSGTVLGAQGTTVDGAASAATSVRARLAKDTTARLRPSQLAALTPEALIRTFDGDASIDLTTTVDDTTLIWNGDWTTTSDASGRSAITTAQTLHLIQDVPGFSIGGVPAPTTIDVIGALTVRNGVTGWELSGTATPQNGLHLGTFTVTSLTLSGFVSAVASDVTVTAGVLVGNGPDAIEVELRLVVDGTGWSATADVAVDVVSVGPFELHDVELTVSADHVESPSGPGATSVSIGFTASAARLIGSAGSTTADMTGMSGDFEASDEIVVSADTVTASIGGALDLELAGVVLSTPGPDGVVLAAGTTTATAPGLGGLTVTIGDLRIHADGRFSASSALVEQPVGFARSVGLAGMIPVDLTALRLDFTNVGPTGEIVDLSEFVVAVDGTVDLSGFADLAFDPVVQIGADVITPASPPQARAISFSAFVASTDPLVVTPLDLGPITLGFEDLTVGDVVLDAELHADGFSDGVLLPAVGGSASITGGFGSITGSVDATLDGAFVDTTNGTGVSATAVVGFSAADRGGASITDLSATLSLQIAVETSGADAVPVLDADLIDVSVGNVTIPFGDFATIQLGDATLDLTPGANGTVFTVGGSLDDTSTGAGIVFDSGIEVLDGWGGRIGGFGLDAEFVPVLLDGFFVDIDVPDGEQFGLPQFVPLRIDELGLALPPGIQPGDSLGDVLADLQLKFSGGLDGSTDFPITATVDGLIVDIGRLAAFDPAAPLDLDTFPIVNLDGVSFAIDPQLNLGGARVSGALTFGTVDVDDGHGGTTPVLYGRIAGGLSTPAFDAGADIVISQYGPVLLRITAPLGVPLGPTGLMLTSVTGAAAFGDVTVPTPRPGHPEDLLTEILTLPTDADVSEESISEAVGGAVAEGTATWNQGFAVALEGDLTHAAALGMMKAKVTLAVMIEPGAGVQLVGRGEVEVFGIPLAEGVEVSGSLAAAGIMIDFSDPLAPQIDLAYESPTPGSPLGVAFPGRTTVVAQVRTDGVIEGMAAGLDAFVTQLATGTLTTIAARLNAQPGSSLARLVRDTNGDGAVSAAEASVTITSTLLRQRIVGLLHDPAALAEIVAPLIVAISDEVGRLGPDSAAALADQFSTAVGDAGAAALRAAGDRFDPSFTFRGDLQPLVLGLPIGSPDTSVEVIIDRTSLGFTLTTSMIEQLKAQLGLLTGTGAFGEALVTAVTLGARDDLTFGVQVPVPSMIDVILGEGLFPTLDSSDSGQNWSVTVSGQFSQFGMAAQVTGFITSPGNEAFVDARVERRYLTDGTTPPDPDKVQFTRQVDYDNLIRYGGLVLNGRLEVPRLLTDPVDVVADIPPIPENPLDALTWFEQFGTVVMATETPAQITLLIPGLGEVMEAPTGAAREAAFQQWADAISVTGVWEGTRQTPSSPPLARLLSLPLGEGRLLATSAGIEVTAGIPMIGAQGTFVLRVDDRDGVPVPVGGVEVTMTTAELALALADLGLPDAFQVSGVDAGAGFRAFTPGFDPDSPDLLRRRGGIAFGATLEAPGLIDDAGVEVVVDPLGTGAGPDFVATAAVDQIGPLAGVAITDADLTIRKAGSAVTIDVGGKAVLFGSQWTVTGHLDPDLTGQLVLNGSAGTMPSIAGFQFIQAGFVIDLARVNGALRASLGLGGTVRLPTWLAARSTSSTASVAGCLASNGASEFRLSIGSIRLEPTGAATLTGTGRALPTDRNAACTLPANALGLSSADARLVLRTTSGGVTTVAIDGAVQVAGSGLPLLTATGALSSTGAGSLTVNFDAAGLDLSGFVLRGGATLKLTGGNNFDLAVNGQMSIPGVVTNATVSGQITQAGIQSLSIATTGLTLPVVTVDSATLTLNRVTVLGQSNYAMAFGATVRVPGLTTGTAGTPTATINGSLATNGDFSIAMTGSNFSIVGVPVSGSLTLAKTGSAMTVKATASTRYSLWSTQLTVTGSLTVNPNGLSGDVTLSLPGGLSFNGFAVGGTLKLAFAIGATNTASVTLTNGTVTVPGIGTLNATASLATNGSGFVQITSPNGIRLGGATSPVFGVGSFRLSLVGGVVTFQATGAGVEYRDSTTVVFSAVVPTFKIDSNGSFSVTANGFTIGSSTGLRLVVPSGSATVSAPSVTANAAGASLKVNLPASKLFVPGLADDTAGKPALTIPAIFVDTGVFSYTLLNATNLNLGLIRLNGKLVFERPSGGAFRLAVQSTTSGVPNVDLGELGKVEFPNFFVDSAGNFDITATTTRIGTTNPVFEIRDASFRFRRAGGSVTLAVNGGDLRIPSLSEPIELPDLSITTTDTFTRNFTIPGIELGPFFKTTSAQFQLELTRTEASLELREDVSSNNPSVTMFAGSAGLTLNEFRVTSNSVFTGSISGQLALFGDKLASATMNISLNNGVLRVTLPSSSKRSISLGFISVNVSGFAQSDGAFSFAGSASTSGTFPAPIPAVSWNGSASLTISNTGIDGDFDGNVSVIGLLSGGASGSITSTGRVSGTLKVDLDGDGDFNGRRDCIPLTGICNTIPEQVGFTFELAGSTTSADTTDPTMAQPSNVPVTTSQTTGSIPVYYVQPTAHDTRDGTIPATCNPGSGALFAVGQSTTVTCRARDAAGNTITRTFSVTVSVAAPIFQLSGNTVTTTLGGFQGGSTTLVTVFSDPTVLGQVTTDANGSATYTITIPSDLPAGGHHIVVHGVAPDGAPRLWVVPITIGADGSVTSITGNVVTAAPTPAGELPATGSSPAVPIELATALVVGGWLLWMATLRRRRHIRR